MQALVAGPESVALPRRRPRAARRVPADPELAGGWRLTREGLVRQALATLDALHGRQTIRPLTADAAVLLAASIECRLARGDLVEAMDLGHELTPYLDRPGLPGALAHHAHGELATALGDPERAGVRFAAAGELLSPAQDDPDLVPWRVGAALAALMTGDCRGSVALVNDHLAHSALSPYATAQGLRILATTRACDRSVHLRRARHALVGVSARRLAAQLDTDLAGALILSAQPSELAEALALLRAAEDFAGRQDLWPLQARVRWLLARLDEVPHRVESEALAALTVREGRVARLVVAGLTNREVAGELALSIKAVEWHLSHIYRKLGVRSRGRLTETLGHPR